LEFSAVWFLEFVSDFELRISDFGAPHVNTFTPVEDTRVTKKEKAPRWGAFSFD